MPGDAQGLLISFLTALIRMLNAEIVQPRAQKMVSSAGQMILKVVSPESVVQITLRDPDNNKVVTVVVKP